ncbi:Galactose oxidase [Ilyonectria robusta]
MPARGCCMGSGLIPETRVVVNARLVLIVTKPIIRRVCIHRCVDTDQEADLRRVAILVGENLAQKPVKAGSTLKFSVTNTSGKVKMSLVCMGSATHSLNSDQRRIPLTGFQAKGNQYTVKLPKDNGVLLPGYYYLFVMSPQGTPSMSKTVQITL